MSDEPTLRQAVLDDPDSEAARRDYAAWCDQQSDAATLARGAFIRVQIDLNALDLDDLRRGAGGKLSSEMFRLHDAYASTWAAPVSQWTSNQEFHRGFVECVRLSAVDFLTHGATLFATAPIRHVDLTDVRDVDESLFDSPLLANLHSLRLDGGGLHDLHLQLLAVSASVGQLRWLSADDNHFTAAAYAALASSTELPRLRWASFSGNPVDPVEMLGVDGEEVVVAHLPDSGVALEQQYGRLEWLHRDGKSRRRYDY